MVEAASSPEGGWLWKCLHFQSGQVTEFCGLAGSVHHLTVSLSPDVDIPWPGEYLWNISLQLLDGNFLWGPV